MAWKIEILFFFITTVQHLYLYIYEKTKNFSKTTVFIGFRWSDVGDIWIGGSGLLSGK